MLNLAVGFLAANFVKRAASGDPLLPIGSVCFVVLVCRPQRVPRGLGGRLRSCPPATAFGRCLLLCAQHGRTLAGASPAVS